MSRWDATDMELRELLAAYCDGLATAEQVRQLESALDGNPGRQRLLLDALQLDADLYSLVRGDNALAKALDSLDSQTDNGEPAADDAAKVAARPRSPVLGSLNRMSILRGPRIANNKPAPLFTGRLNSVAMIAVLAGLFLFLSLITIVPAYLSLRRTELESAQRAQREAQERQLAASQAEEIKAAERKAKENSRAMFGAYAKLLSEQNPLPAARAMGESLAWVRAFGLAQARLSFAVDCRWRGAAPDVGEALTLGRCLVLKSGVAEIVFQNGARTILQGPASMEIRSGSGAYLSLGRFTVAADDPRAKGFVVGTPGMKYTDLGTEFGVMVDADGEQEMHVFRGRVEAQQAGSKEQGARSREQESARSDSLPPAPRPLLLSAHQAIRVTAPAEPGQPATPIKPIAADEKQFIRSQQLSKMLGERSPEFRRWKQCSDELRKRPDLVAYYDFQPDAADQALLRNRAATGPKLDGRIVGGAEWCEGRVAGKKALEFEQFAAGVRLKIDNNLPEATLAAWVQLNEMSSFDGKGWTAGSDRNLIGSDRWNVRPGMTHWRVHANGALSLACCDMQGDPAPSGVPNGIDSTPVYAAAGPSGWHFLASTVNFSTGEIVQYFDGREIGRGKVKGSGIALGEATIGNWNHLGTTPADERPLRGRMDELIILRTALQPAAIKTMYEATAK